MEVIGSSPTNPTIQETHPAVIDTMTRDVFSYKGKVLKFFLVTFATESLFLVEVYLPDHCTHHLCPLIVQRDYHDNYQYVWISHLAKDFLLASVCAISLLPLPVLSSIPFFYYYGDNNSLNHCVILKGKITKYRA